MPFPSPLVGEGQRERGKDLQLPDIEKIKNHPPQVPHLPQAPPKPEVTFLIPRVCGWDST